jgi:hypothetical protein
MVYDQSQVSNQYIKARWKELYASDALNKRFFGIVPKGIYSGFTIQVTGNRTIGISSGSVSGGLGTGLQGSYVSGNFDETVGFSIAVHQNTQGWSTTVQIPQAQLPQALGVGPNGARCFVAIDVEYATNVDTSGQILVCNGADLDANPSRLVVGFIDVPASGGTPLDNSMIGYNDSTYPRLTPISTPQKAGYMPASAWALLNQNAFPWQGLLVLDIDSNDHNVLTITPSQSIFSGHRIYSFVKPNVNSKFPRDVNGLYNGGVNNDQLTKLNVQTGVISGAHQVSGNTSFTTPSVSGNASKAQVGIICLDQNDNIQLLYGGIQNSVSAAMLDNNMPFVRSDFMQVGGFVAETNVSGVIQPFNPAYSVFWRRPFLNVGGGGGVGGGSALSWETDGPNAPISTVEFGQNIYSFAPSLAQSLTTVIKIPSGYLGGTQINLKVGHYTPSTSGNMLLRTNAYLVRKGVDAVNSIVNEHDSANVAMTNGSPAYNYMEAICDLTDINGKINGVSVSAGDMISVVLFRGTDTDTDEIRFMPSCTEVTFT